jgi:hypothetical protein
LLGAPADTGAEVANGFFAIDILAKRPPHRFFVVEHTELPSLSHPNSDLSEFGV